MSAFEPDECGNDETIDSSGFEFSSKNFPCGNGMSGDGPSDEVQESADHCAATLETLRSLIVGSSVIDVSVTPEHALANGPLFLNCSLDLSNGRRLLIFGQWEVKVFTPRYPSRIVASGGSDL